MMLILDRHQFSAFTDGTGMTTARCPVVIYPKSVDFIAAGAPIKEDQRQYVNVADEEIWVGRVGAAGRERLGTLVRARVQFAEPGEHPFKAWLSTHRPLTYSKTECDRNASFISFNEQIQTLTTDVNGVGEVEFVIPLIGGNTYKVWASASDGGGKIEGGAKLQTWRVLACFECYSLGSATAPASQILDVIKVFKSAYIEIFSLGMHPIDFDGTMVANYGLGLQRVFEAVDAAFDEHSLLNSWSPLVIIAVNVDQLADMDPEPLHMKKSWRARDGLLIELDLPRWPTQRHGVVNDEHWLISSHYTESDGKELTINPEAIQRVPGKKRTELFSTITVDLTNFAKISGKLDISVRVIRTDASSGSTLEVMPAGSSSRHNAVFLAQRSDWTKLTAIVRLNAHLHEIGHHLGLVPSGDGALDRSSTYYSISSENTAQRGNHCSDTNCAMFGETYQRTYFCSDCIKALRKQDVRDVTEKL